MDAVAATEKSCKDKISANKEELSEEVETLKQNIKLELIRGFPGASATSLDISAWLSEFISSANATFNNKKDEVSQSNQHLINAMKEDTVNCKKRNEFLEERVKELQLMCENKEKESEKYQKILYSTENILQSLQAGVEDEEQQKTILHEREARELNDTKMELKAKLELLEQTKLECERMRSDLTKIKQSSSEQASDNNQEDQGFLIIDQVEQSVGAAIDQSEEISKLKERLDKEKDLSKSLGTAASKLQSVLKQTQEELNKEREKNKSLTVQEED